MSKWVQHISGEGDKWEVRDSDEFGFWITIENKQHIAFRLPKSEYRLCDPPEEWEDVTADAEFSDVHNHLNLCAHRAMAGQYVGIIDGYRLRKVQLLEPVLGCERKWAFVVERRKS